MSHAWTSHVSYIYDTCHSDEFFTSDMQISDTYEWVMPYMWMSCMVLMKQACRRYERIISHMSTCHVTVDVCTCDIATSLLSATSIRTYPRHYFTHVYVSCDNRCVCDTHEMSTWHVDMCEMIRCVYMWYSNIVHICDIISHISSRISTTLFHTYPHVTWQ